VYIIYARPNHQRKENPDDGNQLSHRTALIEGWGVLNDNKAVGNSEWLSSQGKPQRIRSKSVQPTSAELLAGRSTPP